MTLAEHDPSFRLAGARRVDLDGYPLLHDFAFTENYFVLVQNPVEIDALLYVLGEKCPAQCLRKQRGAAARALVHLVPRGGNGDVVTVPVEPQLSLHHANAFEDERGRVVLDSVCMDRLFAMGAGGVGCGDPTFPPLALLFLVPPLPQLATPCLEACPLRRRPGPAPPCNFRAFVDSAGANQPYRLVRTTVDPASRSAERRPLSQRALEFPKVNGARAGRRHRFVYAVVRSLASLLARGPSGSAGGGRGAGL